MVVDIGAGATKAYVTERGVVRDSHIISRGAQDITLNISNSLGVAVDYAEKLKRSFGHNDPEQDKKIASIISTVIDPILNDVNRVLLNFQKIHNKNVTRVIMTGGGSLLMGIGDMAQKKFGIETVVANPFEKVETPAFLQDILKANGTMFAGALGLALRKLQELA